MASQKPSALHRETPTRPEPVQKKSHALPTPVRCPGCSRSQLIPDSADLEIAMLRNFAKCTHSDDPICIAATKHPANAALRERALATEKKS